MKSLLAQEGEKYHGTAAISLVSGALIAQLRQYKESHYPDDKRWIVVCGMRMDNVHVEWTEEPPPPEMTPRPGMRELA